MQPPFSPESSPAVDPTILTTNAGPEPLGQSAPVHTAVSEGMGLETGCTIQLDESSVEPVLEGDPKIAALNPRCDPGLRQSVEAMVTQRIAEGGTDLRAETRALLDLPEKDRIPRLLEMAKDRVGVDKAQTLIYLGQALPLDVNIWSRFYGVFDAMGNSVEKGPWPGKEEDRRNLVGLLATYSIAPWDQHGYDPMCQVEELTSLYFGHYDPKFRLPVGHPALGLNLALDNAPSKERAKEIMHELVAMMSHSSVAVALVNGRLQDHIQGNGDPVGPEAELGLAKWVRGQLTVDSDLAEAVSTSLGEFYFGQHTGSRKDFPGLLAWPSGMSANLTLEWLTGENSRMQRVADVYSAAGINGLQNQVVLSRLVWSAREGCEGSALKGALKAVDAAMTTYEADQAEAIRLVGTSTAGLRLGPEHAYPQAAWHLYQASTGYSDPAPILEVLSRHMSAANALRITWDPAAVAKREF